MIWKCFFSLFATLIQRIRDCDYVLYKFTIFTLALTLSFFESNSMLESNNVKSIPAYCVPQCCYVCGSQLFTAWTLIKQKKSLLFPNFSSSTLIMYNPTTQYPHWIFWLGHAWMGGGTSVWRNGAHCLNCCRCWSLNWQGSESVLSLWCFCRSSADAAGRPAVNRRRAGHRHASVVPGWRFPGAGISILQGMSTHTHADSVVWWVDIYHMEIGETSRFSPC